MEQIPRLPERGQTLTRQPDSEEGGFTEWISAWPAVRRNDNREDRLSIGSRG
jgi:hypothetical protein